MIKLLSRRGALGISILLVVMLAVTPITVYDCQHPEATLAPVSLIEPDSCPPMESYYEEPKKVNIQILQTANRREVEVVG